MMFKLDIRGFEELQAELAELPERAGAAVARTLNAVAQSTAQRARTKIRTGTRSGHIYAVGSAMHQASAPGEPPANLSGALAASIRSTRITDRLDSFAAAGTDLDYGRTLELGGFSSFNGKPVYIDPRPFLLPSFEEAIVAIELRLKREFERGKA